MPVPLHDDVAHVREDVAYIRAKIETVLETQADHETRIRSSERWRYALPTSAVGALMSVALALFGIHIG